MFSIFTGLAFIDGGGWVWFRLWEGGILLSRGHHWRKVSRSNLWSTNAFLEYWNDLKIN